MYSKRKIIIVLYILFAAILIFLGIILIPGNFNIKNNIAETVNTEKDTPASIDKISSPQTAEIARHLQDIKSVPSGKGTIFTADSKEIWVTLLLNKTRGVSVYDTESGKKIKDINLENGGGVEIILSKNNKYAYVSQMETAKIFEIDVASKTILRTFNTQSSWTKVIELSYDGKIIYASNWIGNDVSEINLETGELIRKIKTVNTPRGLYATKDGNSLYVAGFDKGEIEKIDLKSGFGIVIYKTGGAMRHIVADEEKGYLYVSDMAKNIIYRVSLSNDEVQEFAKTDNNPNTIALSPDKKILYVSCRGKNFSADNYYVPGPEWGTVLLFDTTNGKMLDAIVGGNQPTALAVSPDGNNLVFSDFLDAKLEIFSIPSYESLKLADGGRSDEYKKQIIK